MATALNNPAALSPPPPSPPAPSAPAAPPLIFRNETSNETVVASSSSTDNGPLRRLQADQPSQGASSQAAASQAKFARLRRLEAGAVEEARIKRVGVRDSLMSFLSDADSSSSADAKAVKQKVQAVAAIAKPTELSEASLGQGAGLMTAMVPLALAVIRTLILTFVPTVILTLILTHHHHAVLKAQPSTNIPQPSPSPSPSSTPIPSPRSVARRSSRRAQLIRWPELLGTFSRATPSRSSLVDDVSRVWPVAATRTTQPTHLTRPRPTRSLCPTPVTCHLPRPSLQQRGGPLNSSLPRKASPRQSLALCSPARSPSQS